MQATGLYDQHRVLRFARWQPTSMKVHLVSNSYSLQAGGAEKLVRLLHQSLLERGVDSQLVGLEQQEDSEEPHATCLQLPSAYHPLAFFKLWAYFRRQVAAEDLVHGHLFPSIFYIALLKRLGILPAATVMTEHSTHNRRRRSRVGKWLDRLMYAQFNRIVAISHGVSETLEEWLPALSDRIRVIYNGVRLTQPKPIIRENRPRPIVISVGNLRVQKNYPTMLSAVASLRDLDFEYWIVGDGQLRDTLQEQAQALGIADKTRFLGSIYPAGPRLQQADIFLMASAVEGFGLAAVEAMNTSLPLVISDIPGLSELDDDNPSCSIRVNPHSRDSIASALEILVTSEEKRGALGRAAFLRSQSFGLDAMVDSYLNEYDACRQFQ